MNWKSFMLGVGSGFAGGLAAYYLLQKETKLLVSPEKVLDHAKTVFKEKGPISGSWIHMKPEPYEKDLIQYKVYKGGISKNEADEVRQFEFVADATTGTLLSITPL